MEEIQVTITKNTRFEGDKKLIRISRKEPFGEVLKRIGAKLVIDDVKILYNDDGAMIDDTTEIRDRDILYASQGEKFLPHNKVQGSSSKSFEKAKVLKLGIIGPPSVGKSALTVRYKNKVFIEEYLPSFEDIYKQNIVIEGENVEVDILDSSGLDELVVMRPGWFKEREAFVLVYSIDSVMSFEALKVFYEQLVTFRQNKDVPITVVGNKADMELNRQIKKEDGMKYAASIKADFLESSARTNLNVNAVFENLAKRLFAIKYKANDLKEKTETKCSCNIF